MLLLEIVPPKRPTCAEIFSEDLDLYGHDCSSDTRIEHPSHAHRMLIVGDPGSTVYAHHRKNNHPTDATFCNVMGDAGKYHPC